MIKALEVEYAGIKFRSTLEAGWAQTFDHYGVSWSYEPQAFELKCGNYLPDFWLPDSELWAEAKGPGVPGLEKVQEFGFEHDIIVLEPPERGRASWFTPDSVWSRQWPYCHDSTDCAQWSFSIILPGFVRTCPYDPEFGFGSVSYPQAEKNLPWAATQWKPKKR